MNNRTRSGSRAPFVSTPDAVSTAYGWTCRIAAATLSGVSPPARMTGSLQRRTISALICQLCTVPVPPLFEPVPVSRSIASAIPISPSMRTMIGSMISKDASFGIMIVLISLTVFEMIASSLFGRSLWICTHVGEVSAISAIAESRSSGMMTSTESTKTGTCSISCLATFASIFLGDLTGTFVMNPAASAPHDMAWSRSPGFVFPQILIRVLDFMD